jgi:hypothetical protein
VKLHVLDSPVSAAPSTDSVVSEALLTDSVDVEVLVMDSVVWGVLVTDFVVLEALLMDFVVLPGLLPDFQSEDSEGDHLSVQKQVNPPQKHHPHDSVPVIPVEHPHSHSPKTASTPSRANLTQNDSLSEDEHQSLDF